MKFFSWRNSYLMGSSARMVALCSVLKKNQEWKRSYSTFGFSHIIMRQTCNFYSLLHALMFSWRNIYKGKLLLLLRGFRKFCRFLERQHCTPHPKNDGRKKYHFYSIEQLMRSLYGVSFTHLASHCYSLTMKQQLAFFFLFSSNDTENMSKCYIQVFENLY